MLGLRLPCWDSDHHPGENFGIAHEVLNGDFLIGRVRHVQQLCPHGGPQTLLAEKRRYGLAPDTVRSCLDPVHFLHCLRQGHYYGGVGGRRRRRLETEMLVNRGFHAEPVPDALRDRPHFSQNVGQGHFWKHPTVKKEDVLTRNRVDIRYVGVFPRWLERADRRVEKGVLLVEAVPKSLIELNYEVADALRVFTPKSGRLAWDCFPLTVNLT